MNLSHQHTDNQASEIEESDVSSENCGYSEVLAVSVELASILVMFITSNVISISNS